MPSEGSKSETRVGYKPNPESSEWPSELQKRLSGKPLEIHVKEATESLPTGFDPKKC
jgi:hypothetical protein